MKLGFTSGTHQRKKQEETAERGVLRLSLFLILIDKVLEEELIMILIGGDQVKNGDQGIVPIMTELLETVITGEEVISTVIDMDKGAIIYQ